jgi:hypothetical protein
MAEPITVTISADDDPAQSDHLLVKVDRDLVLLSIEDQDEIRWVNTRGAATINFAPANNPFDPNAPTGGEYVVPAGGSVTTGPAADIISNDPPTIFRQFKYTITVTDGSRSGALDPHARIRRQRVYKQEV